MSAWQILDTCTVLRIQRLKRRVSRRMDAKLAPAGITSSQLFLLAHVDVYAPKTLKQVSEDLGIEKSTMSRNLKLLEKLGLITIGPRRGIHGRFLQTTEVGKAKLIQAFPLWEAAQDAIRASFSATEQQSLAILAA